MKFLIKDKLSGRFLRNTSQGIMDVSDRKDATIYTNIPAGLLVSGRFKQYYRLVLIRETAIEEIAVPVASIKSAIFSLKKGFYNTELAEALSRLLRGAR